MLRFLNVHSEQMIFVDEASKDLKDIARIYGRYVFSMTLCKIIYRSYKGERVFAPYPGRGSRFSALAALSYHGMVGWALNTGTWCAEDWVDAMAVRVLPYMRPFPEAYSLLVVDGASIHKDPRFIDMVAARGCVPLYLPP